MSRWLLLVSTVFGLAMMHTLGHAGMRMAPEAGHVGHVRSVTVVVPNGGPSCADDGCHGGGAMDGWSVCQAVLDGVAVAVLFALLLFRRRHPAPAADRLVATRGASRSPPIPAIGVQIRSTAVLRI